MTNKISLYRIIETIKFRKGRIRYLLLFSVTFLPVLHLASQILPGAYALNEYLPLLKNKKVGVVANQTSYINDTHLIDTLLSLKIKIVKIFSPEHGLLGNVSAGVYVGNQKFAGRKKVPVISLYGKKRMPSAKELQGIDVVLFDLQDVGVRFYTYISTMSYMMEACAHLRIPMIILDRPNPNGFYLDGPVLEPKYKSFVGLHPVPVVYGMTIGEYANMVNGENWLPDSLKCNLTVIRIKGYTHDSLYRLQRNPSPNLRTMEAVYLYPSLCLFEGTNVSIGRGTDLPFEVLGKPGFSKGNYTFTPKKITGVADDPIYENIECNGFRLSNFATEFIIEYKRLYLFWLKGLYDEISTSDTFYNHLLEEVSAVTTDTLLMPEGNIIHSGTLWQKDFAKFLSEWLKGAYVYYNKDGNFMQMMDSLKLIDISNPKIQNSDSIIKIIGSHQFPTEKFVYKWLKNFTSNREVFFTSYFNRLAGTDKLRKQIIDGESVDNILRSWKPDLDNFKKIRSKYLLYPDFREKAKIYFIR